MFKILVLVFRFVMIFFLILLREWVNYKSFVVILLGVLYCFSFGLGFLKFLSLERSIVRCFFFIFIFILVIV